jgi:hypothetical protein
VDTRAAAGSRQDREDCGIRTDAEGQVRTATVANPGAFRRAERVANALDLVEPFASRLLGRLPVCVSRCRTHGVRHCASASTYHQRRAPRPPPEVSGSRASTRHRDLSAWHPPPPASLSWA